LISDGKLYLARSSIISFDTLNREIDEKLIKNTIIEINSSIYSELRKNLNTFILQTDLENEMLIHDIENELHQLKENYSNNLIIQINELSEHSQISRDINLSNPYELPNSNITEIYDQLPYHRGTLSLESHIATLEARVNNIEKYDREYASKLVEIEAIKMDKRIYYLNMAMQKVLQLKDFQFIYANYNDISYSGQRSTLIVLILSFSFGFILSLLFFIISNSYRKFQNN
jgi:hypothetical protein